MKTAFFRQSLAQGWWVAVPCYVVFAVVCAAAAPAWASDQKEEGVGSRAVPASPLTMPAVTSIVTGSTQAGTGQTNLIYVSITGKAQGKFRGEIPRTGYDNKLAGLSIEYGAFVKPDPATGFPSNRRQHLPVKIKKLWGAASPQLFYALVANETLSAVVIDFVAVNQANQEVLDHSITLTDARVTSWSYQTENVNGQVIPVESVDFTFQKITLSDVKSKGGASDDWSLVLP